jgi:hypothetical protein
LDAHLPTRITETLSNPEVSSARLAASFPQAFVDAAAAVQDGPVLAAESVAAAHSVAESKDAQAVRCVAAAPPDDYSAWIDSAAVDSAAAGYSAVVGLPAAGLLAAGSAAVDYSVAPTADDPSAPAAPPDDYSAWVD